MNWNSLGLKWLAAAIVLRAATSCFAVDLSDNLSNTSFSSDSVTATSWIALPFATDSSTYNALSATLLLDRSSATGPATLSLYADGGLQPGSLLGTFTSPATYSSSLSATTFSESGVNLAANTTYWIVLQAIGSATFDWSWTADNS